MPIRLGDLKKEVRPIAFQFLGEPVTVSYRPAAFTPELEEEANAAEPGGQLRAAAQMLSKVVVAWDVVDDDGNPLPVTLEWLRLMPGQFLGAIMKAIMDDTTSPKASGSSFDGS